MKNKIPVLLESRGWSIADLHAKILVGTGGRMSYQALHKIARKDAQGKNLPDRTRLGSLRLIACTLGVKLDDLVDI